MKIPLFFCIIIISTHVSCAEDSLEFHKYMYRSGREFIVSMLTPDPTPLQLNDQVMGHNEIKALLRKIEILSRYIRGSLKIDERICRHMGEQVLKKLEMFPEVLRINHPDQQTDRVHYQLSVDIQNLFARRNMVADDNSAEGVFVKEKIDKDIISKILKQHKLVTADALHTPSIVKERAEILGRMNQSKLAGFAIKENSINKLKKLAQEVKAQREE